MRLLTRLLLIFVPATLLAMGFVLVRSRQTARSVVTAELERRGLAQAKDLALDLGQTRWGEERAMLPFLQAQAEAAGAVYVEAVDTGGKIVAHTNAVELGRTDRDAGLQAALRSDRPFTRETVWDGARVLDVFAPVWKAQGGDSETLLFTGSGRRLGTVRLGIPLERGLRESSLDTQEEIFERQAALTLLAIGVLAVGLMLFIVRTVILPVRRLAVGLGRVADGWYGSRLPVASSDELGRVTASFNRMSETLRQTTVSKEYLDAVLAHMFDPLLVLDVEGRVRSLNRAATQLLGYEEPELEGRQLEVLFAEGAAPFPPGAPLELRQLQNREVELRSKDGRLTPALFSCSVIQDKTGRAVGLVCVARDITERKRLEAALRDSHERVRALLDSTAQAIYGIDNQGNCTFMNRSCLALLRYAKEDEVLGRNMHALIHHHRADGSPYPVEQCRIYQAFREARETHVSDEVVWRSDGSKCDVEYWSHPLFEDGKVAGAVVSVIDITERKRLEAQMLQSEKLSAVGQLAAGVAHEINNPLGIILGFAEGMVRRAKAEDSSYMALKSIEREALRCKTLVQDLLTFSRHGAALAERFELDGAIKGALSLVETQSKVRSVELAADLGAPVWVEGSRNNIQQVVINLCNNAIDAMPGGGRLAVSTSSRREADGAWAILEVRDTGSGIPQAIRDRIFEPFFTTKEPGKGTGLGLSLVYEIVRKHGGTVELQSEEGRGTAFTVRLPLAKEPRRGPDDAGGEDS